MLKYGGTSVATAERWAGIARRVRELAPARRVWVVASALAGVSNLLERAVREAIGGAAAAPGEVRDAHVRLADELGLGAEPRRQVDELLADLESRLAGVRLTGEASPRLTARILAVGELAATRLGAAALARHGIEARWVDARELLRSKPGARDSDHARYLEADVASERDPEAAERSAGGAGVVLTQGFIARTPDGETCLLGRGGSDTSGALFAALLAAERLEIWTDVHGLFTADPRVVPTARLILRIGYREAQELAAMGAKVLHPRCLGPVAAQGIPLTIRCVDDPGGPGTTVEATGEGHPVVTAVTCRRGATLLTLSTLAMWEAPGFLARAFALFEEVGISIDLVATSQSAVSVTLDKIPGGHAGPAFARLVERLGTLARVDVAHPCAVVSVVGRRIRAALHELGAAMEVFRERPVHLLSDSSEDLNLSFVVDEADAEVLVARLHGRLFSAQTEDARLGPTWETIDQAAERGTPARPWWVERRAALLGLVRDGSPRYVYHLPVVIEQARRLRRELPSIGTLYYSMKANPHPRILETVAAEGFGIECVSAAEVQRAREVCGSRVKLLFTPNFCPLSEYALAFAAGAEVILDGPECLVREPGMFRGRAIGVRVDPGRGLGHHESVVTAGAHAKFGLRSDEIAAMAAVAGRTETTIAGLHAHVGSGIFEPTAWAAAGRSLAALLQHVPGVRWLDLGGGLGVPERPGQGPLDLAAVERGLAALRGELGPIELRLEPGRFLVSAAGVLLAPVTQVRRKGGVRYAGAATGMNSLIRPALYGAWHGIHNLTRLGAPPSGTWTVVGPICESGDVLGRDRLLPATEPGDVLLIENAGAYGAAMASRYNLRDPAEEVLLA